MCRSMVDIHSATLRLGEEKRRKKKQDKNIMSASSTQGGHNNMHCLDTSVISFSRRAVDPYKNVRPTKKDGCHYDVTYLSDWWMTVMPQSITSPMRPNWYRFVLSRHAYSFVYHGIQLTVIRLMSAIWHLPVSPLLLWSFRAVDRTCFMCSLVTTFLPCVFFRHTSRKSSRQCYSQVVFDGWVERNGTPFEYFRDALHEKTEMTKMPESENRRHV